MRKQATSRHSGIYLSGREDLLEVSMVCVLTNIRSGRQGRVAHFPRGTIFTPPLSRLHQDGGRGEEF